MRQAPAALLLALIAFSNFYFQSSSAAPAPQLNTVKVSNKSEKVPTAKVDAAPVSATCDSNIQNAFDEVFGSGNDTEFSKHVRDHSIRFLIATVPDPSHTYLGLEFDRLVEGIQQAAAEGDYTFQSVNYATLPWPIHSESGDTHDDEISEVKTAENATIKKYVAIGKRKSSDCPGLLIFRKHGKLDSVESYLVVLLVGEKPTAGLNATQFLSALRTIKDSKPEAGVIGILGPNFSGSYSSLNRLLTLSGTDVVVCSSETVTPTVTRDHPEHPFFVIRSSSTMSDDEINWFRKQNYCRASLVSFFDTVEYQQLKIIQFLGKEKGVKPEEVAVLSEDETAYGRLTKEVSPTVRVYFPRGIATLRTAYQQEFSSITEPQKNGAPRTTLKPDLGTSGEDQDTVPTYDVRREPLSQEAVLQEIVRTLRQHAVEFVIIRATDIMDTVFLAEHLRESYPTGRLIALGADLLARRDTDDNTLRGMLAVSNYPPFQGWVDENPEIAPDIHRIFADSTQEGEFNAALDLIKETENPSTITRDHSGPLKLPKAAYAGFMFPNLDGVLQPKGEKLRPPLWLSVVGRDGYWPLTVLDTDELSIEQPVSKSNNQPLTNNKPCDTVINKSRVACGPRPAGNLEGPESSNIKYRGLSIGLSWNDLPHLRREMPLSKLAKGKPDVLNEVVAFLLAVISAAFVYSTWWGNISNTGSVVDQCLGPVRNRRKVRLLTIGSALLLVTWSLSIMNGMVLVPWTILAGSIVFNTWTLHKECRWETAFWLTATVAATTGLYFVLFPATNTPTQFMFFYRIYHFTTGLSPNLPLLLICGGMLWWIWYQLKASSLFDIRRPLLPRGDGVTQIPTHDRFANAGSARTFLYRRNFALLGIGTVLLLVFQKLRLHSLEGTKLDFLYNASLCLGLVLLLNSLYGAWVYWQRCRDLLIALNRTPLRYSFMEISGFEWRRVWGLAGADNAFAYRPMVRCWQALGRLYGSLDVTQQGYLARANGILLDEAGQLMRQSEPIRKVLTEVTSDPKRDSGSLFLSVPTRFWKQWVGGATRQMDLNQQFCRRIEVFQSQLSILATMVYHCVLEEYWQHDRRAVTRSPKKKGKELQEGMANGENGSGALGPVPAVVQWAEEFVALVYISFIIRVLIRIRWLGMTAIGMYVFLLLAATLYPFEPKGTIHAFFVFVFLSMLCTIGLIYAQMHRDDTLSHLTDTQPGQLGGDYWWRMASFAGVPLFTLVTTQVPQLSRTLFFWVKPLLDGIGRG